MCLTEDAGNDVAASRKSPLVAITERMFFEAYPASEQNRVEGGKCCLRRQY